MILVSRIPQFVTYSDLPHTKGKMVACTQPRRVAAMSVAKRVAEEMNGTFLVLYHSSDNMLIDGSSSTWARSRVFDPIRGYDYPRHNLSQIHDRRDASSRSYE